MTDDLDDLGLFREFARTRSRTTRNELVERHMGLASHIAQRYSRAGRHDDDLRQVAMIGLVKSVDRFDPDYGVAFSSFAGRTIEGEIKRHFRDKSWTVKVPRSAKELHLQVRNAVAELEQRTGRSPSVPDIAEHLGVDRDDVLRGLAASAAATVGTIDAGTTDEEGSNDRLGALADEDQSFDQAENEHVIENLMQELAPREREIVRLRFYEDMSQLEIAGRVGVSQMHVSRLLRRSFEQMRASMNDDPTADG